MSHPESLGRFVDLLIDQGELVRVSTEVDRNFEIAAITAEVAKSGGPALLFDRVRGSSLPVVTNLFGTIERTCLGLGIQSLDELAQRITNVVAPAFPTGWLEALALVPQLVETTKWTVQKAESAICQQVVHLGRDVDLGQLPIGRNWPAERQSTFLSGLTFVSAQATPEVQPLRFANRIPIEIVDRNTVLIHWSPHDPAWRVIQTARERGAQQPVVIVLGADPALTLAAGTPLPHYVDPFAFAGFLRSNNVQIARGRSIAADVPAHAEIILEGVVEPARPFQKSTPIGLPTGFFSEGHDLPAVQITAITHRANPIVPLLIGGHPAAEEISLAKAVERMFVPLVRLAVPEVVDINRPASAGARDVVFVSIRKSYVMQAQKVMNALWGLDVLSTTKTIVVVDDHVDVHDEDTVRWLLAANVDAQRDVVFSAGPAHRFDHASSATGVSSRMGIDATNKLPAENHPRNWPAEVKVDSDTRSKIRQRWAEFGLGELVEGRD